MGEETDSGGSRSRKANTAPRSMLLRLVIFSVFEQNLFELWPIQDTIRFLLPHQWPRKGTDTYTLGEPARELFL